jgi:uncharacterized protein YggE
MLIRRLPFLLILAAPLLAQLSNNTVTVTASQSSTAQPDEVVFAATVTAGLDKSLNDIVAAVLGVGINAANLAQIGLASLSTPYPPPPPGTVLPPSLDWTFWLAVPFSKSVDSTAALTSLQKTISQNSSGLALSFQLLFSRVSAQQTPNCKLADLVSQARAQAQEIAGAAGLNAGAIAGVTSATSNAAPPICSLTVRFALGPMFGAGRNITITATRSNTLQPDQVLILLSLQSGTDAALDDITTRLTAAGISGESFTGVNTSSFYSTQLQAPETALTWAFTLTTPLSKISPTVTQLVSAQKAVKDSSMMLNFYVGGLQVSQQLEQSQPCKQGDLLLDAQAQAKQVAAAAGVSAGSILSIAEGGSVAPASLQFAAVPAVSFTGVIAGGVGYPSFNTLLSYPPPICSLTVQFQLM